MAQQREHDQLQLLMQQQQLQQVRQQQQQQRRREETDADVARAWALRHNMVEAVEAIILSCGTSIQGVVSSIATCMHVPPPVFRAAQAGSSVRSGGGSVGLPPLAAAAGPSAQVMVWKTNFGRCLEDCVMPGSSRAGQSPLGGSSQALMPPGSRAPAAANSRSSFNHSPLPQQQLAEGQVRPASANKAGSGPWQQQQGGQRRHLEGQAPGPRRSRRSLAARPA
ncbi:hypothetical protein V8C86DRAFT_2472353 [Haematococcus lacustris]